MPSAQASLETDGPSRYLDQFAKHAASIGVGHHGPQMHHSDQLSSGEIQVYVDRTDTDATITINPYGRCTITADAPTLTFHAEAATDPGCHPRTAGQSPGLVTLSHLCKRLTLPADHRPPGRSAVSGAGTRCDPHADLREQHS